MDKQITTYEWGLSYAAEKKKQYVHMVESMYFVMILLFFISPGIAILILMFIIVLFINISKSDPAERTIADFERYRIDMDGITVENVRNQKSHKYSWNELASYCPYSVQKPLYGAFFKKYAGDDFMIERVGGSIIKIEAGVSDSAMVNYLLSKKMKIKNTLNTQNYKSFRMNPVRVGSSDYGSMMSGKNHFSQPRKFATGAEEKRFYEEKRRLESNYARTKENSFRNKVFAIYIILVILSLFAYMIYSFARDIKKDVQRDVAKDLMTADSDLTQDIDTVKCSTDSDCQYYYFTSVKNGNLFTAQSPQIRTVSDSKGCVWALINKKYGPAWAKRYPVPKNCIFSSEAKDRKDCDIYKKVCVVR